MGFVMLLSVWKVYVRVYYINLLALFLQIPILMKNSYMRVETYILCFIQIF